MRRIAVFARRPVPGRVKTRLSPALPAALACDLHRAMLDDALAAAAAVPAAERFLYWDGVEEHAPQPGRGGFAERLQREGDLGARLSAAFADLLLEREDPAVVLGADCPDLEPEDIVSAFTALADHDLVMGPARDGGFYLIGLARPAPELFQGIAWGTERVLEQTLAAARTRGLDHSRLAERDDLDTPADLVRWIAARVARASDAAHDAGAATAAALRRMKLLP